MDQLHGNHCLSTTSLREVHEQIYIHREDITAWKLCWFIEEVCFSHGQPDITILWEHEALRSVFAHPFASSCTAQMAEEAISKVTKLLDSSDPKILATADRTRVGLPALSSVEELALDGPWWLDHSDDFLHDLFFEGHGFYFQQKLDAAIEASIDAGVEVDYSQLALVAGVSEGRLRHKSTPKHLARHAIAYELRVDPNELLPCPHEILSYMAQELLKDGSGGKLSLADIETYALYRSAFGGRDGQSLHSPIIASQLSKRPEYKSHLNCIQSIRRAATAIGAALQQRTLTT
jgi:hypothetical protein